MNALKVVGKRIGEITIALSDAGAAGFATLRILAKAGVKPGNVRVVELVEGKPTILTNDMDSEKLFPIGDGFWAGLTRGGCWWTQGGCKGCRHFDFIYKAWAWSHKAGVDSENER